MSNSPEVNNISADQKKRHLPVTPTGESPDAKKIADQRSPTISELFSAPVRKRLVPMPSDDADPTEWFKAIIQKLDDMSVVNEQIQGTLKFQENQIKECEKDIESQKKEISQLTCKVNGLERENWELKSRCSIIHENNLKTEINRRELNVIFDGIPETHLEDHRLLYHKIVRVLNQMEIFNGKAADVLIVRCQRIGPINRERSRSALVQFLRYNDVQILLHNRKQLPEHVYVKEDYPSEIEERRKILRPIFNKAKNMAKYKGKCRLTVDKLVLDGKSFTVGPRNNLKELPPELNQRSAAERENNEILAFFTIGSPFSNFHSSVFVKDRTKYICSEQYIQAKKAEIFKDDTTQTQIMNAHSPYEMKRLGAGGGILPVPRLRTRAGVSR